MPIGEPEDTGGPRIVPKNVVGHLLLVWATDYVAYSPTAYTKEGDKADVVVVDVVDLDQIDPETSMAGLLARNCWWRQSQLIGSLRGRIGNPDPVLVKMEIGKGTRGIPPFVITSQTADAQCMNRANVWFASHADFKPSSPGGGPSETPAEVSRPAPAESASGGRVRDLTPGEETTLERLARQSQQNKLPPASPGFQDEPPF